MLKEGPDRGLSRSTRAEQAKGSSKRSLLEWLAERSRASFSANY
jgi:hypothetical protein